MQNEKERVMQTRQRERDEEAINTPGDCSRCREDRCPLGREGEGRKDFRTLWTREVGSRGASREWKWSVLARVSTVNSFVSHDSHQVSIDREKKVWEEKGLYSASRRVLVHALVCKCALSLSTTGHHNILWHFCNSGRLPCIEKGNTRGGEKVTDHLTPYLVKENRLDSLDCDQLYYPPRAPSFLSKSCYQVAKAYSPLSMTKPPSKSFQYMRLIYLSDHTKIAYQDFATLNFSLHFDFYENLMYSHLEI